MVGSTIITAMRFCPASRHVLGMGLELVQARQVGNVGQRHEVDVVRGLEGGEPGVEVAVGELDAIDLRGPGVLQEGQPQRFVQCALGVTVPPLTAANSLAASASVSTTSGTLTGAVPPPPVEPTIAMTPGARCATGASCEVSMNTSMNGYAAGTVFSSMTLDPPIRGDWGSARRRSLGVLTMRPRRGA